MKKKPTPKESPPPTPLESFTVGTGFTKRQKYRSHGPLGPEHWEFLWGPSDQNNFDVAIAGTEASARQILTEAGLPPESIIDTGSLIEMVAARGYKERVDLRWYAAQILDLARDIRWRACKGEPWVPLAQAVELGELIGEAKARGYFKNEGAKGGAGERRIIPIKELVRHLIRKNREATAQRLWEAIPTDSMDGIRIKDHKFYRNGGRLLALGKLDGCKDWRPVGKSLKLRSFEKQVSKARTSPAR